MEIVLLGAGNTATVLGKAFQLAGHSVKQVYSRTISHATELASILNSQAVDQLELLEPDLDVYLICVSDSALPLIAGQLRVKDKLVAHTAGSVSIDVLREVSSNTGVFYPLQSLRKEADEVPEIPILIDGNNPGSIEKLKRFAESISSQVQQADDKKRKELHLAAVFCNNFSNYLFTLTEEYCQRHQLDFKLLFPLIRESFERLATGSPAEMQTGPARRGDHDTIDAHLQLLKDEPAAKSVYAFLSGKILEYYGHLH